MDPVANMEKMIPIIESFRVPQTTDTDEILNKIRECSQVSRLTWQWHIRITGNCSEFPTFLMLVLEKDITSKTIISNFQLLSEF